MILMDAADIGRAKSFTSSPELKARMAVIGVTDATAPEGGYRKPPTIIRAWLARLVNPLIQ